MVRPGSVLTAGPGPSAPADSPPARPQLPQLPASRTTSRPTALTQQTLVHGIVSLAQLHFYLRESTRFCTTKGPAPVLLSSTPKRSKHGTGCKQSHSSRQRGQGPRNSHHPGRHDRRQLLARHRRARQGPAGNWTDKTEWHNLVAFQRTAEIVRDYVKKGTQLYIEGKIQTRSWDDKESGQKKYRTEILVNDLHLLGGRGEGASRPAAPNAPRRLRHQPATRRPRPRTGKRLRRTGHHRRRHSLLNGVWTPPPDHAPSLCLCPCARCRSHSRVRAAPQRNHLSAHRAAAAAGRSTDACAHRRRQLRHGAAAVRPGQRAEPAPEALARAASG